MGRISNNFTNYSIATPPHLIKDAVYANDKIVLFTDQKVPAHTGFPQTKIYFHSQILRLSDDTPLHKRSIRLPPAESATQGDGLHTGPAFRAHGALRRTWRRPREFPTRRIGVKILLCG